MPAVPTRPSVESVAHSAGQQRWFCCPIDADTPASLVWAGVRLPRPPIHVCTPPRPQYSPLWPTRWMLLDRLWSQKVESFTFLYRSVSAFLTWTGTAFTFLLNYSKTLEFFNTLVCYCCRHFSSLSQVPCTGHYLLLHPVNVLLDLSMHVLGNWLLIPPCISHLPRSIVFLLPEVHPLEFPSGSICLWKALWFLVCLKKSVILSS